MMGLFSASFAVPSRTLRLRVWVLGSVKKLNRKERKGERKGRKESLLSDESS
jgi:hypothetical protein